MIKYSVDNDTFSYGNSNENMKSTKARKSISQSSPGYKHNEQSLHNDYNGHNDDLLFDVTERNTSCCVGKKDSCVIF